MSRIYEKPSDHNIKNLSIHLTTNQENDEYGNVKLTFNKVLEGIRKGDGPEYVEIVNNRINDIIIKTILLAKPSISYSLKRSHPYDIEG